MLLLIKTFNFHCVYDNHQCAIYFTSFELISSLITLNTYQIILTVIETLIYVFAYDKHQLCN